MPLMRGLILIVASRDAARFRSALEVAAAQAALGRPARLFLQADAVALLRSMDELPAPQGQPTLRQMLEETLALGATVTACQSGLALAGMTAADLPVDIETGGLVELLAGAGDDQLLMA